MSKSKKALRQSRIKSAEYKAFFYLSYPVFLGVALIGRLAPQSETRHGLNIFAEAREMANTIIPFAFMH